MKQEMVTIFALLLCASMVFAATQGSSEATLTLNNNVPTIITVTGVSAQDPIENSITTIEVNFTAEDLNGVDDINFSTAVGNFINGAVTRTDSSCTNYVNGSATQASFQCLIDMNYYDVAGSWTINVTVNDLAATIAYNDTTTFTYNSLKAFVMSPGTLSFGTLNLGDADQEATSPTTLNNTGNVVIASGGINITGYDLMGQTDASDYVPAAQFYANITTGATGGDNLVNASEIAVTGAALPIGAAGANQEQLFWYVDVPASGLIAQVYATTGYNAWLVDI